MDSTAMILQCALAALTLACVAVTLLPLVSTSTKWWVRAWDFPRVQIAAIALVLSVITYFTSTGAWLIMPVLLVLCAGYQASRVLPYTRLVSPEVQIREATKETSALTLMAANVEMDNEDTHLVARLIAERQPDVLLLMETNQRWRDALDETLRAFPVVAGHIAENHYGMIFATRLDARSAEFLFLTDDSTPTVSAHLIGGNGKAFRFIGLHPRPPVPGQDTAERDEQIKRSATIAHTSGLPVVSMGDFNDVAWSRSSRKFKAFGGYFDPRIGRSPMPSFDARNKLMRFPIDQLYFTRGIGMFSFERGPFVGSDHFPIIAEVVIDP